MMYIVYKEKSGGIVKAQKSYPRLVRKGEKIIEVEKLPQNLVAWKIRHGRLVRR